MNINFFLLQAVFQVYIILQKFCFFLLNHMLIILWELVYVFKEGEIYYFVVVVSNQVDSKRFGDNLLQVA